MTGAGAFRKWGHVLAVVSSFISGSPAGVMFEHLYQMPVTKQVVRAMSPV